MFNPNVVEYLRNLKAEGYLEELFALVNATPVVETRGEYEASGWSKTFSALGGRKSERVERLRQALVSEGQFAIASRLPMWHQVDFYNGPQIAKLATAAAIMAVAPGMTLEQAQQLEWALRDVWNRYEFLSSWGSPITSATGITAGWRRPDQYTPGFGGLEGYPAFRLKQVEREGSHPAIIIDGPEVTDHRCYGSKLDTATDAQIGAIWEAFAAP